MFIMAYNVLRTVRESRPADVAVMVPA
jgi:hypothetical protein